MAGGGVGFGGGGGGGGGRNRREGSLMGPSAIRVCREPVLRAADD